MSDTVAHARHADPDTSHDAADSVGDVRRNQAAVLTVLEAYEPATDETLVLAYIAEYGNDPDGDLPRQSPSGIRSRRAELVRAGLVRWTGAKSRMTTGRLAREWETCR